MPPSGVDYASEFLNGYAPEYVHMDDKYNVSSFICLHILAVGRFYSLSKEMFFFDEIIVTSSLSPCLSAFRSDDAVTILG